MIPLVAGVDDDVAVRESLESLIRSVGMAVTVFASAEEFLNSAHPNKLDCLISEAAAPPVHCSPHGRARVGRAGHLE
jgi:FixJ family two-component response regulator